jgi:predicted nucleic acid-binding protein
LATGRDVLLDTGPLVAVLDASDSHHGRLVPVFSDLLTRMITTEAVVTEACHLVGRGGGSAQVPLELLIVARIPIMGLDSEGHQRAARLMVLTSTRQWTTPCDDGAARRTQYRNRPDLRSTRVLNVPAGEEELC